MSNSDEMSRLLEDSNPTDVEDYNIIPQLLATIIVSWLSIIVGYSSAYSSPAESSMVEELNITKDETTWISSLLPVGALIGSLSGGPFIEFIGRKHTLILTDIIFLIGWTLNFFARTSWNMYISRLLNGYSVGITSFTLPVYLAETLQPAIRGRLGLFPTAFGNFGILICFIFGNIFHWKGLAIIGIVFTIPFLIIIWIVPETPRWFLSKRKISNAKKSLLWLRGKHCNITKEIEDLQQKKMDNSGKWTKNHFKVFSIVLGLMLFQQLSGINAIIFYSTQIFEETGTSLNASICTAVVGVVNFISTFIAAIVIDRLGRKMLLYISSIIMATMLAILGLYFFLFKVEHLNLKTIEWLPLICFIVYVLGFSFGFGPIPWLMMGEILPAAIRGQAASISAAFNWSCTFIITKMFPIFVDTVGAHYAFGFFSFAMVCSIGFLKFFVPETKRKTLEDIERFLAN